MPAEAVRDREKRFFDREFACGVRDSLSRFYVVAAASGKCYEQRIFAHCQGKRVLEYGCGTGSSAFALASQATEVVGIDISEVAIVRARQHAAAVRAARTHFLTMDAENTSFESASFDMVCGSGILHHLDVGRALREVARILKPDGTAVFVEPMGHNPAINLFRRLTPGLRTQDEHPLVARDLRLMGRFFGRTEHQFFNLFSLPAFVLNGHPAFLGVLRRLDELDRRAFRWSPSLGLMAWLAVLVMKEPRVAALQV